MREPLKNSTNYISGYDQFGNLKRSRKRANEEQEEEAESKEEDEDANEDEELAEDAEEAGAEETDRKRGDGKDSGIVPKERESDLKPFPLNKNFKSESILSEPLREEIYRKAVEDGHSVSTISAFHGVDMRRVAAVVRLKTVEKNWIKEVRVHYGFPLPRPSRMMINNKNRLVLKTSTWLQNTRMRASLTPCQIYMLLRTTSSSRRC